MLRTGERLEPLGNGIEIIVSDKFCFTTDTILLANFAQHRKSDRVVDLCTGCGIIPLLLSRENPPREIHGVEIFAEGVDMMTRSVKYNSLTENIFPLCSDIKELKGELPFGYFSLVTCNPPYKLSGSGLKSRGDEALLARHEEMCTLEDVISVGSKLLQFSGRLCICQRPERLTDAMELMRKYDVEPKRLRLVQGKFSKAPKLFLLEGKRGSKPGFLNVMPALVVENEDGAFTEEMLSIYGSYKDNAGRTKNEL
ncbi:MAG: methyltransferase [Oscillospiraceae bacterium]|nr:methyltransferase [Oscillospiraceae bacterium]